MFTPYIGIDLGTTNILVYLKGKGIVFDEPSVVAKNIKKNKVIAIGKDALAMIGRTPQNISTFKPLENGVISEYRTAKQMISLLINKVSANSLFKPVLVVTVPSNITQVERRAVINCAIESGVKEVHLVEEPWAAALGSGLSINKPEGNMIIDIGGGTTNIAVISLNGVVISDSIRIGGNDFDNLIKNYVRKTHNLLIGDSMAENIKIQIGSAFSSDKELFMDVKGRDLIEGNPKTIKLKSQEIRDILKTPLEKICQKIKEILEQTPPDLCSDIIERGILLTGGSGQLRGLDKLIYNFTNVAVHVAEDPIHCVIKGCGKALDMIDNIKDNSVY